MNTNKIATIALIASASVLSFSFPAYADTSFSNTDVQKVNACLILGGNTLKNCVSKVKPNKPYAYLKTKGRNRNISNKGKVRKAVYSASTIRQKAKSTEFLQPKKGGLRIDACVKGTGWKKSSNKRCDKQRLKKIGNDFCKSTGHTKSLLVIKEAHTGPHAILNYNKSTPKNANWSQQKGKTAIKKITCQ